MSKATPRHGALAESVLKERYFVKDENGEPIENWEGMCRRVAKAVAAAEKESKRQEWEDRFYEVLVTGKFLPNSPTLMNAGLKDGLLSACFVLPIDDNMESIFGTLSKVAMIQKAGGGTGFSFSRLRPIGAKVGQNGGTSSGAVSFISIYDAVGEVIKQGGRRRAANMGMLRVDHPEIVRFIKAKERDGVLSNFNLSVAITDDFMEAVKSDANEPMVFMHPSTGRCHLDQDGNWHPRKENVEDPITYAQLFALICQRAWENGEPGIFFIDTANKDNPAPDEGEIESTNPCGELPAVAYMSCNLGSINLSHFVTSDRGIDWNGITETTEIATRFLDDVIDVNCYPIPEIEAMTKKYRPIGLGVMGFADMLLRLGLKYGSDSSVTLAGNVMEWIDNVGHVTSRRLADGKGPYAPGKEERNCQVTTIAPTGTLSILAACSSGIEPVFRWSYKRRSLDGEFIEYHPYVELYVKDGKLPELPSHFVTTNEVPWDAHVKIQAAFQRHTDAGVSKTINLPQEADITDVMAAILFAHEEGCKGLTVYRDQSRANQVIDKPEEKKEVEPDPIPTREINENSDANNLPRGFVAPRPDVTAGMTRRYKVACGKLYVTYSIDPLTDEPCEVFVQSSESGGCTANTKALGMMVSKALRSGMPADDVIRTLRKVACPACRGKKNLDAKSCPDAIARAMIDLSPLTEEQVEDDLDVELPGPTPIKVEAGIRKKCPDCEEPMDKQSGCWVCSNCGYSKCG